MKKLNLGCGEDIKESFVNMDFLKLKGIDIVHDLNKFPYPYDDNEFDIVYASHILEHLNDLSRVMGELRRICKNGAKIFIRAPHFSCGLTYNDPTHKLFFGYFTFDVFTDKSFYDLPKFRVIDRKLNFTRLTFASLNYVFNPILAINPRMYERFFCWMLPCSEVLFTLEVEK
jgi:SAM-dependent methyltransferase